MYLVYAKECIRYFIEKCTKIQPSFSKKKRDWFNKMAGKLFCIYTKAD